MVKNLVRNTDRICRGCYSLEVESVDPPSRQPLWRTTERKLTTLPTPRQTPEPPASHWQVALSFWACFRLGGRAFAWSLSTGPAMPAPRTLAENFLLRRPPGHRRPRPSQHSRTKPGRARAGPPTPSSQDPPGLPAVAGLSLKGTFTLPTRTRSTYQVAAGPVSRPDHVNKGTILLFKAVGFPALVGCEDTPPTPPLCGQTDPRVWRWSCRLPGSPRVVSPTLGQLVLLFPRRWVTVQTIRCFGGSLPRHGRPLFSWP